MTALRCGYAVFACPDLLFLPAAGLIPSCFRNLPAPIFRSAFPLKIPSKKESPLRRSLYFF